MTSAELNDYILHYLKKDKTQSAIMLTGEWGSGKSFYIKNELVPFLKDNEVSTVVVSLYGIDDISTISKNIYMELRMRVLNKKHCEAMTTSGVIAKNIIKNITALGGINIRLSDRDLNKIYKSVNLKDKLLILEDVERSNINIINILGYVNGLVEQDGVKVLLVSNENEILKKGTQKKTTNSMLNKGDKRKEKIEISDDVIKYLRIKEKTISDTIQFNCNLDEAIKQILKTFNNDKLNKLCKSNNDLYQNLVNTVSNNCEKNLRTFIFALQKTVDLIEKIEDNKYEDDFFECLFLSIIHFSSKIKVDEFPKWEGDEHLSSELGLSYLPLMRFAYDYIRWQSFDNIVVQKDYEAYKDFKLYDDMALLKDDDLSILYSYAYHTEKNVINALNNIERRLQNSESINISTYSKLGYYLIYVGSEIEFDYKKSLDLMLRNIQTIEIKFSSNVYLSSSRLNSFESKDLKEEYEKFINDFSNIITEKNYNKVFSYKPADVENLYNNICKNTSSYTVGHKFISKYDPKKIIDMLDKSTAKQMNDFRGILFAVYRHACPGEFDEKDIEALKQLLKMVEDKFNTDNNWDKIQLMQIKWLKSNLNDFIKQMS